MGGASAPGSSPGSSSGKKRKHAEVMAAMQAGGVLSGHTYNCSTEDITEITDALVANLESSVSAAKAAASGGTASKEQRRNLRADVRKDIHALANLANPGPGSMEAMVNRIVDQLVGRDAVACLVPLLNAEALRGADEPQALTEDIEKEAAYVVGLLAVKEDHQLLIAGEGAVPLLVKLLKRRSGKLGAVGKDGELAREHSTSGGVARRAADAITNLAHENVTLKNQVRIDGGIPPLVALLESADTKVQRAAAGALRTLALKNDDNKKEIVECGALPTLIFMLRSEDKNIHYEAVGVVGNLVHSSQAIKKRVLAENALQPIINLLSSKCTDSQREAALLIGQFANPYDANDPAPADNIDLKVKIVQRGGLSPLIKMLRARKSDLKEMAAFALGRLAQNADNQAGICQEGGLRPLLELLDEKSPNLQHNAAFALYGLAENPDNVAEMVKEGAVQRLSDGVLMVQASKDCVNKTLKRLEDKLRPPPPEKPDAEENRVLRHLLYFLRCASDVCRERTAVAMAYLVHEDDFRRVFVDHGAIDVLLDMASSRIGSVQMDAAKALARLAERAEVATSSAPAPQPPQPKRKVNLGPEFVNSETVSDITFVVEGKPFYAHRIALVASSDAFRAMLTSGYREQKAVEVEIPNVPYKVFEAMMRCCYTGTVEVTPDISHELLRAADQYLLDGLKKLCEHAISKELTPENLEETYALAEDFHAPGLRRACIIYAFKHRKEVATATANRINQEMNVETVEDDLMEAAGLDAPDVHGSPAGRSRGARAASTARDTASPSSSMRPINAFADLALHMRKEARTVFAEMFAAKAEARAQQSDASDAETVGGGVEGGEEAADADAANADDVDEAIANVVLDEDLNVSDDEGGAPAGAEEDMQQADGPAQEQQQAQQQQQQQQGQQHGHNLQNGGELQAQPGGDAPMAVADD